MMVSFLTTPPSPTIPSPLTARRALHTLTYGQITGDATTKACTWNVCQKHAMAERKASHNQSPEDAHGLFWFGTFNRYVAHPGGGNAVLKYQCARASIGVASTSSHPG